MRVRRRPGSLSDTGPECTRRRFGRDVFHLRSPARPGFDRRHRTGNRLPPRRRQLGYGPRQVFPLFLEAHCDRALRRSGLVQSGAIDASRIVELLRPEKMAWLTVDFDPPAAPFLDCAPAKDSSTEIEADEEESCSFHIPISKNPAVQQDPARIAISYGYHSSTWRGASCLSAFLPCSLSSSPCGAHGALNGPKPTRGGLVRLRTRFAVADPRQLFRLDDHYTGIARDDTAFFALNNLG